ncbi:MAG: hypothetical protein AAF367_10885 [Pseudomonadota bacterium]
MEDIGNAKVLASTLGLAIEGFDVIIWRHDQLALEMPPMDFHVIGLGLTGRHEGQRSTGDHDHDHRVAISFGSSAYIPPGRSVRATGQGQVIVLEMLIAPQMMDRIAKAQPNAGSFIRPGFNRRFFPGYTILAMSMIRDLVLSPLGQNIVVDGLGKLMIASFIEECTAYESNDWSYAAASTAAQRIHESRLSEFDLDAVSAELGLSPTELGSSFLRSSKSGIETYGWLCHLSRGFCEIVFELTPLSEVSDLIGIEDPQVLAEGLRREFGFIVDGSEVI